MKAGSNRDLQPPLPPALLEALNRAKEGGSFAAPCSVSPSGLLSLFSLLLSISRMVALGEDNHAVITLVTSDDPPVELTVVREELLDSRVFSDMLSLPMSSCNSKARVNVEETVAELEAWIEFLRSGKVETFDGETWDWETDEIVGRRVVAIAKLADKYQCTSGRLVLIDELWQVASNSYPSDHLPS